MLFDRYVVVDWSASSGPVTGANSIWIAELADGEVELSNPPTRRRAAEQLDLVLDRSGDERVLLGFDASLGYPAGMARLLGLDGVPWEVTWRLIADLSEDDDANRNNRFSVATELNRRIDHSAGPFWGCPPSKAGRHLATTKPPEPVLGEFRTTEQALRSVGLHPASCWQLLGAGSVGSQTLTLLPVVVELLGRHRGRIQVWPFTTGLATPDLGGGGVVVAEVWPTLFHVDVSGSLVKDAAQVSDTARALRDADRDRTLPAWFAPELSNGATARVVGEEGWVLGPLAGAHLR